MAFFRRGVSIGHEGSDVPIFMPDGSTLTVLISPSTTAASLAISIRQHLQLENDGHFALCEAEGDVFSPIEETIVLSRLLTKWPQSSLVGPRRLVYKRILFIPRSPAEKAELNATRSKDAGHSLSFVEAEHCFLRGKIRLSPRECAQAAACLLLACREGFDPARDTVESIAPLVLECLPLYALKAGTPGVPKNEATGAIAFEGGCINTTSSPKLTALQNDAVARNNGLGTAFGSHEAVSIEEMAAMVHAAMVSLAHSAGGPPDGSAPTPMNPLSAERAFLQLCKRSPSYGFEVFYGCKRAYKDKLIGVAANAQQGAGGNADGGLRSRASSSVKFVNGQPVGKDGKPLSLQQQLELSSVKEDVWLAVGYTGILLLHSSDPLRVDSYSFDSIVKWVASKDGKVFAFNSTVPAASVGPSPAPANPGASKGESVYILCARSNDEEPNVQTTASFVTTPVIPASAAIIERCVERCVEEAVRLKKSDGSGMFAPPRPMTGPGVTGVANILAATPRRPPPYATVPSLEEQSAFLHALRTPPPAPSDDEGANKKKSRKSIFHRQPSADSASPAGGAATEGAFARLKHSLTGKSGRGARADTSPAVVSTADEDGTQANSGDAGSGSRDKSSTSLLSRGRSKTAVDQVDADAASKKASGAASSSMGAGKTSRARSIFNLSFRSSSQLAADKSDESAAESAAEEEGKEGTKKESPTALARRGTFSIGLDRFRSSAASKSSRSPTKAKSSRGLDTAAAGASPSLGVRRYGPAGGRTLHAGFAEKQAHSGLFRKPWQKRWVVIEGPRKNSAQSTRNLAVVGVSSRTLGDGDAWAAHGAFSYWESHNTYAAEGEGGEKKTIRALLSLKDAEVAVPLESLENDSSSATEQEETPEGGSISGHYWSFSINFTPGAAMIGALTASGAAGGAEGGNAGNAARASTSAAPQTIHLRCTSRLEFVAFLNALADAGTKITGPGAEKIVAILSTEGTKIRMRRGTSRKRLSKASGGSSGKRSTGSAGKESTGRDRAASSGAGNEVGQEGPENNGAGNPVNATDGDDEDEERTDSTEETEPEDSPVSVTEAGGPPTSIAKMASTRRLLHRASSRRLPVGDPSLGASEVDEDAGSNPVAAASAVAAANKRASMAVGAGQSSAGASAVIESSSVSVRDAASRFGSATRPSSTYGGPGAGVRSYVPSSGSGESRPSAPWATPGFSLRKASSSSKQEAGQPALPASGDGASSEQQLRSALSIREEGESLTSTRSPSPSPSPLPSGASSGRGRAQSDGDSSYRSAGGAFGIREGSSVADGNSRRSGYSDNSSSPEGSDDGNADDYDGPLLREEDGSDQSHARRLQELSRALHAQAQASTLPIGSLMLQGQVGAYLNLSDSPSLSTMLLKGIKAPARSPGGGDGSSGNSHGKRGPRLSTAVYFAEREPGSDSSKRGAILNGLGGVDNNMLSNLYAQYGAGFGGYQGAGGDTNRPNSGSKKNTKSPGAESSSSPVRPPTFSGPNFEFETLPLRKEPLPGSQLPSSALFQDDLDGQYADAGSGSMHAGPLTAELQRAMAAGNHACHEPPAAFAGHQMAAPSLLLNQYRSTLPQSGEGLDDASGSSAQEQLRYLSLLDPQSRKAYLQSAIARAQTNVLMSSPTGQHPQAASNGASPVFFAPFAHAAEAARQGHQSQDRAGQYYFQPASATSAGVPFSAVLNGLVGGRAPQHAPLGPYQATGLVDLFGSHNDGRAAELPPTVAYAMQHQHHQTQAQGGHVAGNKGSEPEQPFVIAAYGSIHPPPADLHHQYRGAAVTAGELMASQSHSARKSTKKDAPRLPPSPPSQFTARELAAAGVPSSSPAVRQVMQSSGEHELSPQHGRSRSPPQGFKPRQAAQGTQRRQPPQENAQRPLTRQDLPAVQAPDFAMPQAPSYATMPQHGYGQVQGAAYTPMPMHQGAPMHQGVPMLHADPFATPLPSVAGVEDVVPLVMAQNQQLQQQRLVATGYKPLSLPPPPPSAASPSAGPVAPLVSSLDSILGAALPTAGGRGVTASPLRPDLGPRDGLQDQYERFRQNLQGAGGGLLARRPGPSAGIPSVTPGRNKGAARTPFVVPPPLPAPLYRLHSPLAAPASMQQQQPVARVGMPQARSPSPLRKKGHSPMVVAASSAARRGPGAAAAGRRR